MNKAPIHVVANNKMIIQRSNKLVVNGEQHMFRDGTRSCKNEKLNNENANELELKEKMRT